MNHHLILVEEFKCPNDPSYVTGGNLTLVGSPKANWSQVKGQTKSGSEDPYETGKSVPCLEDYRGPALEPGLGMGPIDECLVAGLLPMGPGWAQPKAGTWVCPPVGPSPTGGIIGDKRRRTKEGAGFCCLVSGVGPTDKSQLTF